MITPVIVTSVEWVEWELWFTTSAFCNKDSFKVNLDGVEKSIKCANGKEEGTQFIIEYDNQSILKIESIEGFKSVDG